MKHTLPLMMPIAVIAAASPGFSEAQQRTFVKGTVTSAGTPARSVWVIVSMNGHEKGRALTGDDGKYYIANLDPGTYDIVVQRDQQLYKGRATLPANSTFDISF